MSEIEFINLAPGDYDRAKAILNKARHPGFVGRELFYRCATTGVCCVASIDGTDLGVALIAKERLQALSVTAEAQGKGIGSALMRRLQPKWVNAIRDRISFFERLGYKPFGAPKIGQNGKHATQLMERGEVIATENVGAPSEASTPRQPPEPELPPVAVLTELAGETDEQRILAQLAILDDSLARARAAEQHKDVLAILAAVSALYKTLDRLRIR